MNNNIQEPYCSFEVSKLLKEKGFDVKWNQHWYFIIKEETKNLIGKLVIGERKWNNGSISDIANFNDNNYAIQPTHALAIMWIRENFLLNIVISKVVDKWHWKIQNLKDEKIKGWSNFAISPEEATEAALKYCLENLIK